MNSNIKPYRLINNSELAHLQQTFECKLQIWNDMHALFPLSCLLSRNPKRPVSSVLEVCDDTNYRIALLDKSCLSMLKHSLFGAPSDCFNDVTEVLFDALLSQLLGNTHVRGPAKPVIEDWFYTGSPTLALTLTCASEAITLYLHPKWVINTLPAKPASKKVTASLHEVVAAQHIELQVELNPLSLKLSDIMQLHVGNVIKTDHPITEPMKLMNKHHTICNVDLGKSASSKSILTTRTS